MKSWLDYQDGQKILLTTPTVLCGYRVEVYRREGTTQWYTAFIKSYDAKTTVSSLGIHFSLLSCPYRAIFEQDLSTFSQGFPCLSVSLVNLGTNLDWSHKWWYVAGGLFGVVVADL